MLLAEVTSIVLQTEAAVRKTMELAVPLAMEHVEDTPVEKLKTAAEQTMEAERAAALLCAEAKKIIAGKQRAGQAKDTPSYTAELAKLQSRLNNSQTELMKQRKIALAGEKSWKNKQIVDEKEKDLREVDAEIMRVEILTTPLGDERPSDDSIREMDAAVKSSQQKLSDVTKSLEKAAISAQGPLKTLLARLLAGAKKSQDKLEEIKSTTQEARERVACEAGIREAQAKLAAVETSFQQVSAAEVPYLKGIEILPVDEATQAVAASEAAIVCVNQAIAEARTFLTGKSLEVRQFVDSVAKSGLKEIAALSKTIEGSVERLGQFKTETAARKRIAQQLLAKAKVAAAEEAVGKAILASAELASRGTDELSDEEARTICQTLSSTEEEAQTKLDDAKAFVIDRQRKKESKDIAELTQLTGRLNDVQVNLAKAKATAAEHNQKFVAKRTLIEIAEVEKAAAAEVQKATEAVAPLVDDGGQSFVNDSMCKKVLDALLEYGTQKSLSKEKLFTQIHGAKDGKIAKAALIAYLEKFPELSAKPEVAFSKEQLQGIYGVLDPKGAGFVTKAGFVKMFEERLVCVHEITVTKDFDIEGTESIEKLQIDDIVEAVGEAKTDEKGTTRVKGKVVKNGTVGWITVQGNQGKQFLLELTRYVTFVRSTEKILAHAKTVTSEAASKVSEKTALMKDVRSGPLAEAKGELAKVRPRVNALSSSLGLLKKKVEEAKKQHSQREEFERKKAEEKKERKAAAEILKALTERVSRAQAAFKKFEVAAAPLAAAQESELSLVEAPLTVKKTVEGNTEVAAAVAESKDILNIHWAKVEAAKAGPWFEARQEMVDMLKQLDTIEKKAAGLVENVRTACETIAANILSRVSTALRASMAKSRKTSEALYTELAGDSGGLITDAALENYLGGLADITLSKEQKELLLSQVSVAGGVTRRGFFQMLERYFKCVKEIALTSQFDIKDSTTKRKLEVGDDVLVLEGPTTDDLVGLTRIRAKAMSDGFEGWVTIKGNHGTPFLRETEKPSLAVLDEVPIENEFNSEVAKPVGTLKVGEVLEILEGPRKETKGCASRGRGCALSDGAKGWFTVTDKKGVSFATPGRSCYTCISTIALTNDMDIKDCRVVRKLDRGETMMVLEGPKDDATTGVTRIRVQSMKDQAEGWVTVKGNAGTVYAQESGRHYTITEEVQLQAAFASDSDKVRTLLKGESIDLTDGPKDEKAPDILRVKARALSTGTVGWVTLRAETLKAWGGQYKCSVAAPLHTKLASANAAVVRQLEVGEVVDLLEGPTLDKASELLRLRVMAKSDGAVGWVNVSGVLESVAP